MLEQDLCDLLHASWNLRRISRLEADLSRGSRDRLLDDSLEAAFTRFARYHARFERSYYRALRRQLQPAVAYELPILVSVTEYTKRTHRPGGTAPRADAPWNVERETALPPPRPNGAATPPGNSPARTPPD